LWGWRDRPRRRSRERFRRLCGRRRFNRFHWRYLCRIREPFEKLFGDRVRVEADRLGVRAYERAPEDPRGPSRDVVSFETLEEGRADFCVFRDGREGDLAAFALAAQAGTESFFRHQNCPIPRR